MKRGMQSILLLSAEHYAIILDSHCYTCNYFSSAEQHSNKSAGVKTERYIFFYFNVLQIPKLTRLKPEIRDFINLSEHKTCNYAYESCSESNAFYFTMLAHNVRGKWWWCGNRGWNSCQYSIPFPCSIKKVLLCSLPLL